MGIHSSLAGLLLDTQSWHLCLQTQHLLSLKCDDKMFCHYACKVEETTCSALCLCACATPFSTHVWLCPAANLSLDTYMFITPHSLCCSCCRSPAINTQLRAFCVNSYVVRALQDFPRHAMFKEVCFRQRGNANLEELLREALRLRMSCLRNVITIRLEVRTKRRT